ncbi:hypothetical protein ACNJT3_21165, partial [Mycobacterium tuberculosis]
AVDSLVDLDAVTRVVKVVGFVASAPGFHGQPSVIMVTPSPRTMTGCWMPAPCRAKCNQRFRVVVLAIKILPPDGVLLLHTITGLTRQQMVDHGLP